MPYSYILITQSCLSKARATFLLKTLKGVLCYVHVCHAHICNLNDLSQLATIAILSMPFPYATKAYSCESLDNHWRTET